MIKATLGLRITHNQEIEGVDISIHAETAYDIGALRSSGRTGA
jgi:Amt family ammonium transporter